jgi:hypothetical protein
LQSANPPAAFRRCESFASITDIALREWVIMVSRRQRQPLARPSLKYTPPSH